MDIDLETIEKSLKSINRQTEPVKWSKLMNMKGMVLSNKGLYKEAEGAFISALYTDDVLLKCKVLINYAMTNFLKKDMTKALELTERLFELQKANKKLPLNLLLAHTHYLRGEIYYSTNAQKQALSEFMKAEYFFEVSADIKGVGLSCLEIARIHIKNKNLTAVWNFLRKAENFLARLGAEEKLGVAVCKGIALYYSGKETEAMTFLKEEVYPVKEEFGKGIYLIDEILDIYLNINAHARQYHDILI